MGTQEHKKVRILPGYFEDEGEDRISSLPDELIHKILSFLDAKVAVQSSVLSKRWKLIWTTLPFLGFGRYIYSLPFDDRSRYCKFIRHVLSNRNHQSHISELKLFIPGLSVSKKAYRRFVIKKFIKYAISHNVQDLIIDLYYVHKPYKLSTFSSRSLKKLKLEMRLQECALESDLWDLPALTTLHLVPPLLDVDQKLPESCLTCLPALRTLSLEYWDLSLPSFSFNLPDLTTLRLHGCTLPRTAWDLPALLSLHLDNVNHPENMTDMFSTLVNLISLTLSISRESMQEDHFISCPQLLNLNITTCCHDPPYGNIVVSAPKLCNFSSVGIFSITFGVPELENVNIKLRGWFEYAGHVDRKKYYQGFTCMLSGLGAAKNLSFDLESIEALSEISNFLASFSSPFYNLKCVKLPKEYKESSISSALRSYLLGGSPRATIVTSLPQNRISQTQTVSVAAENVAVREPLASPAKELGDCQYVNKTVCVDTVDMGVREQHVMDNSLVDGDRVRQTDALVEETGNDRVSSFRGNKDFGLWQGHEVNSEFVCLLIRIMNKYPETFEHFTTKNKKLCTVRLNMLCTSLNEFTKISMTEVDSEIIVEYRDIFAYLQNLGFNLSWLLSRLNYIQHLRFSKPLITELHAIDCRIDDAKGKVQDLQARVDDAKNKLQHLHTLRAEKMTEIHKDFGTMGTNLAVGFIGDYLLSGP